jgi:hypothetical protein
MLRYVNHPVNYRPPLRKKKNTVGVFGPFFRVERKLFVLSCSVLFVSQVLIFYEHFFSDMSACSLYVYGNSLILGAIKALYLIVILCVHFFFDFLIFG